MKVHLKLCGQGKPLVFFHGWGFDHQIWLPLLPLLQNRYQVILVDLPGFGLSPLMDWCTFKQNLLAILPKTFVLAGWSMGGLYATRLALEEPLRVVRLLNMNSSPCFIAEPLWPAISESVFEQFYQDLLKNPEQTLHNFISLQGGSLVGDFLDLTRVNQEGLRLGLETLKTWDFRKDLSQLKQAACFMFGKRDRITPVALLNSMEKAYPDFHYVLFPHAAHMPFLSHRDLFIKELDTWLQ